MPTIEPDDVVVAAEEQLSTTVEDEVIVLNHDTGTYHGLSGVGPRIWELIQEPVAAAEVAAAIRDEYDVDPERATREVTDFLDEMADASLIEVEDGSTA